MRGAIVSSLVLNFLLCVSSILTLIYQDGCASVHLWMHVVPAITASFSQLLELYMQCGALLRRSDFHKVVQVVSAHVRLKAAALSVGVNACFSMLILYKYLP